MRVNIDDVMAELERLRIKTEEEFDGEEDSTIKQCSTEANNFSKGIWK